MTKPPPVGTKVSCLLCSREEPWGIWHKPTGVAVCVGCRDRANGGCQGQGTGQSTVLDGMPHIFDKNNFNGRDPCDMLIGPCACGAWHKADEWVLVRLR